MIETIKNGSVHGRRAGQSGRPSMGTQAGLARLQRFGGEIGKNEWDSRMKVADLLRFGSRRRRKWPVVPTYPVDLAGMAAESPQACFFVPSSGPAAPRKLPREPFPSPEPRIPRVVPTLHS